MPQHRRTGRALVHRSAQWYHDPMQAGTAKLPDDFVDAHRRHWTDAELLYGRERWPNADHLYGLSAECGLKAVMRCLDKMPEKKHLPELWSMFEDFARGREGGRHLKLPDGQPFDNWLIDHRYAHREHFDQGRVVPHREAAQGIRVMVGSMKQDGDK